MPIFKKNWQKEDNVELDKKWKNLRWLNTPQVKRKIRKIKRINIIKRTRSIKRRNIKRTKHDDEENENVPDSEGSGHEE